MIIDKKIAFVGGDLRFLTAAKAMGARGFESAVCGFDAYTGDFGPVTRCTDLGSAVGRADAVVLPLPYSADGRLIPCPLGSGGLKLSDLIDSLTKGQILFGGCLDESIRQVAGEKGVAAADYYENESLCVKNAIPTAEGALAIAMNEMPITLNGAKACVLGYGRIGKVLARLLKAMGAETTVAARKATDRTWIEVNGIHALAIDSLKESAPAFDVIFNTIPHAILTRDILSTLKREVLLVDLASRPGGIDFDAAGEFGLRCVYALSLPGKCSPVSAGLYIADALCEQWETIEARRKEDGA